MSLRMPAMGQKRELLNVTIAILQLKFGIYGVKMQYYFYTSALEHSKTDLNLLVNCTGPRIHQIIIHAISTFGGGGHMKYLVYNKLKNIISVENAITDSGHF